MAKDPNPNMEVWNKAEETPVKHTKKINFGRGFTAIDAQYCVMKATELFGPVGEGWGYHVQYELWEKMNIWIADVTVWHGNPGNSFGPYRALSQATQKNGTVDLEAPKKAATDALTKGLSHLGIGADVFLGKYDDNRYVAELRAKQDEEDRRRGKTVSIAEVPSIENEEQAKALDDAFKQTMEDL